MKLVKVYTVSRQKDGTTKTCEFEVPEGFTLGRKLKRELHAGNTKVYSIEYSGHVQENDGEIEDNDTIWVREGREFYLK